MNKKSYAQHNQYYVRLLTFLRDAAAFMPLVMVPFGLLVQGGVLNDSSYAGDHVLLLIVALYTSVSLLYFYVLRQKREKMPYMLFMVLFHVLMLSYVLFVSGLLSAFLAMWILLLISTDIYYGTRGFLVSFLMLALAGALSIAIRQDAPPNEALEIIQGVAVVGLIGYVIARIRAATDRERLTLMKTREQESFQRERLLALINSMGDGVVTTSEAGKIKVYNAAFLALLDTNRNLIGKNIDDVMKIVDDNNKKVSLVASAKNAHKIMSRRDLSLVFEDEEEIHLYINISPVKPGFQSKTERGMIFIMRDITKEKSLEEERDEFISVVSHELRTPVAIAEGSLGNLMYMQDKGVSGDTLQKATATAHEQILYLAKMVNDLSTLSRAERGVGDAKEEIDMNQLFKELYEKYSEEAKNKGLHLDLDIPARLPTVTQSRLYLEEMLQNFITNAIKYTQEGSVTIHAKVTDKGLECSVSDTGIGISKSDQGKIFQKFYRSEDYRTRETSGTGLGLYVVKKLASKLGVKVEFQSRLNHGSTFGFTLPLRQKA